MHFPANGFTIIYFTLASDGTESEVHSSSISANLLQAYRAHPEAALQLPYAVQGSVRASGYKILDPDGIQRFIHRPRPVCL